MEVQTHAEALGSRVKSGACPSTEADVILAGMVTLLLTVKRTVDEANEKAQASPILPQSTGVGSPISLPSKIQGQRTLPRCWLENCLVT